MFWLNVRNCMLVNDELSMRFGIKKKIFFLLMNDQIYNEHSANNDFVYRFTNKHEWWSKLLLVCFFYHRFDVTLNFFFILFNLYLFSVVFSGIIQDTRKKKKSFFKFYFFFFVSIWKKVQNYQYFTKTKTNNRRIILQNRLVNVVERYREYQSQKEATLISGVENPIHSWIYAVRQPPLHTHTFISVHYKHNK